MQGAQALFQDNGSGAKDIKQLPGSLDVVLDALEQDHAFLRNRDVFTKDLIDNWIEYKRKNEVDAIRLRPHPWEFALYSTPRPSPGRGQPPPPLLAPP